MGNACNVEMCSADTSPIDGEKVEVNVEPFMEYVQEDVKEEGEDAVAAGASSAAEPAAVVPAGSSASGGAQLRSGLFEDPEFPATKESIGGVSGDDANPDAQKHMQRMLSYMVEGWARPSQLMGSNARSPLALYGKRGSAHEPSLWKHVSPRDISQGGLGDCWLVSAFSALAEYPDRVKALFKQDNLTEDGRYDIRLYDVTDEEWKTITIDDRIPFCKQPGYYGYVPFARPTLENEFWTCLLEKAVAKFVGGYWRLDGGFPSIALEMLTGKPSIRFSIDLNKHACHPAVMFSGASYASSKHATVRMRNPGVDEKWGYWSKGGGHLVGDLHTLTWEDWWRSIAEWDSLGYIQCASTRQNYNGIIAGHAYNILRVVTVTSPKLFRMLHVRNPHHKNEWKGQFSDIDHSSWSSYPEVARACGREANHKPDNGVFWIEFEEFKKGFSDVSVNFTPRRDEEGDEEVLRYSEYKEMSTVKVVPWRSGGKQPFAGKKQSKSCPS
eukprot:TRINITY_DN16846_c0_g1_i2.p1 TRINITY_DN16846_c0_g1~~TRINITY_DN16846_c0_g1_i2.p1  ORF type:complete len:497 (-),score=93.35 TRINITY_DN16846_c0_g1_i2:108-1598(-)